MEPSRRFEHDSNAPAEQSACVRRRPLHRGIAPEPVGVVRVLVPREASMDGLTQRTAQGIARPCAQPVDVVRPATGRQTGIGRDRRAGELKPSAAVENGAQGPTSRFTLLVSRPNRPPPEPSL